MGAEILVDSSFFIDRLRLGEDPFEELAAHAEFWDFATCGVVTVEVLRGVKLKTPHQLLEELFACMVYIPTLNRIWENAAQLAWMLDRRGRSVRVPDLVIACCALDHDAAVLTLDSDFNLIPNLRVLHRLD